MTNVRLSRHLAEQGYSYAEMARMTRNAELVRVRRGAYAPPPGLALDARAVHRQLTEATLGQSSTGSVVSHQSAAVLHDLPIGNDQLNRVHLTRNREGQGKVRRYVHVHGLTLDDDDVVQVDGLPVTSLARTVLDIACSLPPLQAVPVGDAALRAGMPAQELATQLDRSRSRHGIAQARRTASLLDARSESAGESMSRVVFVERRIPMPQPQFEVFDRVGRLVARSDFGWKDERTLGEFDGKVKYGELLLKQGQSPQDALFEEKRREDMLRDLGWQVVRWVWADLYNPAALIERLHRAFARGRPMA